MLDPVSEEYETVARTLTAQRRPASNTTGQAPRARHATLARLVAGQYADALVLDAAGHCWLVWPVENPLRRAVIDLVTGVWREVSLSPGSAGEGKGFPALAARWGVAWPRALVYGARRPRKIERVGA